MSDSVLRKAVNRTRFSAREITAATGVCREFVVGALREDMTPEKFQEWWDTFIQFMGWEDIEEELRNEIHKTYRSKE